MMGLRMWRLLLAAIGASMLVAAPAHAPFDRLVAAPKDTAVDAITQPTPAQPASEDPPAKAARLPTDQRLHFPQRTHVVTPKYFAPSRVRTHPTATTTQTP